MKKGFTLAELIGVIVVLALISLITIPAVSKILKQNKKELCENQMRNIIEAARSYGAENIFALPSEDGDVKTITLGDLIDGGYISGNIENPVTKEIIDPDSEIYITKNVKKINYELSSDFNCDIDKETEEE